MNPQATGGPLIEWQGQVGAGMLKWVEGTPIVLDLNLKFLGAQRHSHLDAMCLLIGVGVSEDVGEVFFEGKL